MKNKSVISEIVSQDLCCSCGACARICPSSNCHLVYSEGRYKWQAHVQSAVVCGQCNGEKLCLAVCPSYKVDYTFVAGDDNQGLGRILSVKNGWSEDKKIRMGASSGGFIRALCRQVLTTDIVDGIIALKHHDNLEYYPSLYTDTAELDIMPTSIYHNVNFENLVSILEENKGNFLVIGLPCHLTSLRLLLQKNSFKHLQERVYATIALICGYTYDRINIQAFAHFKGVPFNKVTYRGQGRFRRTVLSNDTESSAYDIRKSSCLKDILDYRFITDPYLVQKSCLYCMDHIGMCADLVVGDAWLKKYSADVIGNNIIIARSEVGYSLMTQLEGFHLEEGSVGDIAESQGANYTYGIAGKTLRKQENLLHESMKVSAISQADELHLSKLHKRDIIKQLLYARRWNAALFTYLFQEFGSIVKTVLRVNLRRIIK